MNASMQRIIRKYRSNFNYKYQNESSKETFLTSLIVFSYFQNSSCSNKNYQVMVK